MRRRCALTLIDLRHLLRISGGVDADTDWEAEAKVRAKVSLANRLRSLKGQGTAARL